jgi:2-hydroxy-6-oxonona-2,4-dienedioate hydrolase
MAVLAERGERRAIALDLPGHGFATKGPTVATCADDMAERVLSALDELGLGRFDLIGTSLRGLVAAKLALAVPERLGRLVLVGSLGLQPVGIER